MKHTIQEKIDYNKKRKTPFGFGYVHGTNLYIQRLKSGGDERARIDSEVDDCHDKALNGDKQKGSTQFSKGVMCAMRDMAQAVRGKRN